MDAEHGPIAPADATPDACGCAPPSAAAPTDAGVEPVVNTPPTAAPSAALKLVVQLLPAPRGPGYRALLSLGRDGFDPELRAVAVADLAAALDEVPALLADAEARWCAFRRR